MVQVQYLQDQTANARRDRLDQRQGSQRRHDRLGVGMGLALVYAPDDTVTAISIFNDYAGAEESNRRALAWIEQNLAPLLTGPATAMAGPVIVHTFA